MINKAKIVTRRPIKPDVIFFLAASRACLSPPEAIMLIAPVTRLIINQIIAIKVINPMVEEIKTAKSDGKK